MTFILELELKNVYTYIHVKIYIYFESPTHLECFPVKIIAKFAKNFNFYLFQRLMYHQLLPGVVRRRVVLFQ